MMSGVLINGKTQQVNSLDSILFLLLQIPVQKQEAIVYLQLHNFSL